MTLKFLFLKCQCLSRVVQEFWPRQTDRVWEQNDSMWQLTYLMVICPSWSELSKVILMSKLKQAGPGKFVDFSKLLGLSVQRFGAFDNARSVLITSSLAKPNIKQILFLILQRWILFRKFQVFSAMNPRCCKAIIRARRTNLTRRPYSINIFSA